MATSPQYNGFAIHPFVLLVGLPIPFWWGVFLQSLEADICKGGTLNRMDVMASEAWIVGRVELDKTSTFTAPWSLTTGISSCEEEEWWGAWVFFWAVVRIFGAISLSRRKDNLIDWSTNNFLFNHDFYRSKISLAQSKCKRYKKEVMVGKKLLDHNGFKYDKLMKGNRNIENCPK